MKELYQPKEFTLAEIKELNLEIENALIQKASICYHAHFCCVYLNVTCKTKEEEYVSLFDYYQLIDNIGFILKKFYCLFKTPSEYKDNNLIQDLSGLPLRLLFKEKKGYLRPVCVGFGHFLSSSFFFTKDFVLTGIDTKEAEKAKKDWKGGIDGE